MVICVTQVTLAPAEICGRHCPAVCYLLDLHICVVTNGNPSISWAMRR